MNNHPAAPTFGRPAIIHYAAPAEPAPGRTLDARHLFAMLRRRLAVFAAVAGAVLLVTLAISLLAPPKYTATTNLAFGVQRLKLNTDDVLASLPAESSAIDTEVEGLKARQLTERVVSDLHLDADPEFNAAPWWSALAAGDHSPDAARARHQRVVDQVARRLAANRLGSTYLVRISFTSQSQAKAATIANRFAELYLAGQARAKMDESVRAANLIQARLEDLRTQVLAADRAVQTYKIDNNLMSAQGASLTEQEITSSDENLGTAQAQLAEDAAKLSAAKAQLARGSNGDDVGETLASPVVQDLRKQRAEVARKVATLEVSFGDRYPPLKQAKEELATIDQAIHSEISRTMSNLQAKVEVSRDRAASIGSRLGALKGALAATNRAQVGLDELERNAQAARTLYEGYLNRYKEIVTQEGLSQADARIQASAAVPTHKSSPKLALNLMIGTVLAFGLGAGAVLGLELLHPRLRTAEDVEQGLKETYLGSIPELSSVSRSVTSPSEDVVAQPFAAFAESFRLIGASLFNLRRSRGLHVVAITSALPAEGKTTTAVCLARTAALQGWRVLLIDCDVRRPSVGQELDLRGPAGLAEVLGAKVALEDAVVRDAASGADVLLVAKPVRSAKDMFADVAMDRLLEEVRHRYDLVVLDTPPVLPVGDARVLAASADGVICVTRWGQTASHAVKITLDILNKSGAQLAGVVITRVDMAQHVKTGYGDPAYYYAKYKDYYAVTAQEGSAAADEQGGSQPPNAFVHHAREGEAAHGHERAPSDCA